MERISEGNGGDALGGDFSLIGSNGNSSGMMVVSTPNRPAMPVIGGSQRRLTFFLWPLWNTAFLWPLWNTARQVLRI
jgi:hypothetical protein